MFKKILSLFRVFAVFGLIGFFMGIFLDIINAPGNRDSWLFSLLLLWVIVTYLLKLKSDITIKVILGLLTILFVIFVFAQSSPMVERIVTWIYFLLAIAVVQQFFELYSKHKKTS